MRAARRAEIDHTVEWQDGGGTDADNLALLCPKHHALKSLALFTLQRRAPCDRGDDDHGDARVMVASEAAPLAGELVWTTLLGFEHPAEPWDRDHILGPRTVDLTARSSDLSRLAEPPEPPEPEHRLPPDQHAEPPPPF